MDTRVCTKFFELYTNTQPTNAKKTDIEQTQCRLKLKKIFYYFFVKMKDPFAP
jgi:hypothetical protein